MEESSYNKMCDKHEEDIDQNKQLQSPPVIARSPRNSDFIISNLTKTMEGTSRTNLSDKHEEDIDQNKQLQSPPVIARSPRNSDFIISNFTKTMEETLRTNLSDKHEDDVDQNKPLQSPPAITRSPRSFTSSTNNLTKPMDETLSNNMSDKHEDNVNQNQPLQSPPVISPRNFDSFLKKLTKIIDETSLNNMSDKHEHDEDQNEPLRSPSATNRSLRSGATSCDSMSTESTADLTDHSTVCSEDFLNNDTRIQPTSHSRTTTHLHDENTNNVNTNITHLSLPPVSYLYDVDDRGAVKKRYYLKQGLSLTTHEPYYYVTPSYSSENDSGVTDRHLNFHVVTRHIPSNNSTPGEIATCSENFKKQLRVRKDEVRNVKNSNPTNKDIPEMERSLDHNCIPTEIATCSENLKNQSGEQNKEKGNASNPSLTNKDTSEVEKPLDDNSHTYNNFRKNFIMRRRISRYYKYMMENKIDFQFTED